MADSQTSFVEQDRLIASAYQHHEPRLRRFVRSRTLQDEDVEDVLQDVFYELISAYRLMKPAEEMTAWLFRVARNRVTDLFRRRRSVSLQESSTSDEDGEGPTLEDLLPSPDAGPEAVYLRELFYDALDAALEDLPAEQREVFIAHEFEGRSFKELAEVYGVSVNTLLSRKRRAVLYLRERLAELQQELDGR
jgi:RNA polymerase sigma factor (sigma-70 family)